MGALRAGQFCWRDACMMGEKQVFIKWSETLGYRIVSNWNDDSSISILHDLLKFYQYICTEKYILFMILTFNKNIIT